MTLVKMPKIAGTSILFPVVSSGSAPLNRRLHSEIAAIEAQGFNRRENFSGFAARLSTIPLRAGFR